MAIQAWAPGHATLFFSVPHRFENPIEMGSLGGGINFDAGVTTSILEEKTNIVYWNEKPINGNVSLTALQLFLDKVNINASVRINHHSDLKLGYGVSTSGAGAIGTVLALNAYFETNLKENEMFQIAHVSDVINHTGLGSVMGQIHGGLEIRVKQGGPKIGKVSRFFDQSPIILGFIGPLKTSDVLTSENQMLKITKYGQKIIQNITNDREINNHMNIERMFELGRKFAIKSGLMTSRLHSYLDKLDNLGESCSTMAMIGETLVIKPNSRENVISFLSDMNIDFCQTQVTNHTPKVIFTE